MSQKLLAQIICTSPSTCTSNCTALLCVVHIVRRTGCRGEKGTTPSALNVGYCPAKSCGALGLRAPLHAANGHGSRVHRARPADRTDRLRSRSAQNRHHPCARPPNLASPTSQILSSQISSYLHCKTFALAPLTQSALMSLVDRSPVATHATKVAAEQQGLKELVYA